MPDFFQKQSRRKILKILGSLWLSGFINPAWAIAAKHILAARLWPAREYTRLTLELDQPVNYRHYLLKDPDRLVIDLESIQLTTLLQALNFKVSPNDPQIQQLRVGQYQADIVRLVLDLKTLIIPQAYVLPPIARYQYRLVFDLYPKNQPDPLLELLKSTQDKEARLIVNELKLNQNLSDHQQTEAFFQRYAQQNMLSIPNAKKLSKQNHLPSQPRVNRLLTIMLDPGHGGEDPGAVGRKGSYEKDVVLAIARRLRDKIDQQPNMHAVMTRDADYFVPLAHRVRKARRVKADLFISIHADAFTTPHARGSSVFILSERGASSTLARWLAKSENASDLIGGIDVKTQDASITHTLLDMSTAAQMKDSAQFGATLLSKISIINPLHKPKVEKAGFAVLKTLDIPSVLVETAFISNPEEETKLNHPHYQQKMADALFTGIKDYFRKNPPLAKGKSV